MIDRIEALVRRYRHIQEDLARPEVVSDPQKLAELGREMRGLQDLVAAYEEFQAVQRQLEDARAVLRTEKDPEMLELFREEEKEIGRAHV